MRLTVRIHRPRYAGALVEADIETFTRAALVLSGATLSSPGNMFRCRSVSGCAADADVRPRGLKRLCLRAVILLQIGRVTPGALVIPILVDPGPMQRIAGLERHVRIKMIPALAAAFLGTRVPCDPKHLITPARHRDQILLQGIHTERVLDLEIRHLAVRPVGSDPIRSVLLKERALNTILAELCPTEIAEHGAVIGFLHRRVMLRSLPLLELRLVTRLACLRADKFGRLGSRDTANAKDRSGKQGDEGEKGGATHFPVLS